MHKSIQRLFKNACEVGCATLKPFDVVSYTCAETGQLCSKTAIDTADFIEFMNNLFDCLNSRSLYCNNPYNSALTHTGIVKTFLINASKYFINLKKIKKGKISQPPCFKGLTQTINAILQFFEDEKCNDIFF